MTLRARRIYYSLAILVFCLAAPLIVATASGWRWSGWRQGFVGTGTVLISATPRATVVLNGKTIGTTPKRMSGLTPGTFRLALNRPGYRSWEHLVQVDRTTGTSIGPVRLFRKKLPVTLVRSETYDGFIVSADQRSVAGWTTTPKGTILRLIWPSPSPTTITLSSPPDWITVSEHQQRLAVGLADSTEIYSFTAPTRPWTLPPGGPVFWLSSSESISYRLEHDQLIAYDHLTSTQRILQAAQSMAVDGTDIWLSRRTNTTTSIEQRANTLTANTATLVSLRNDWRVVGTVSRGVFVSTPDRRTGELLTINRLTGRIESTPLGGITAVLPRQTVANPLWVNEVDLVTLTEQRRPQVLFRAPLPLIGAEWIASGDILVTMDSAALTIRSVSSRQGRGTLVSYPWPAGTTPLILDAANHFALFAVHGQLQRLSWK